MKHVTVSINGNDYTVEFLERSERSVSFRHNGRVYTAQIAVAPPHTPATERAPVPSARSMPPKPSTPRQSSKPGDVVAPMPGIVVSVPVTLGQRIEVGDVVAVVEAMKMENSIKSPCSGSIHEIAAQPGAEVSTGQLLVRLA